MKKEVKNMLTLQFIPHTEIAALDSEERIKKLLDLVKDEKIILLEGRLRQHEEAELIKKTMEAINEKFTGIELGVIGPEGSSNLYSKMRKRIIQLFLGNREGFTIIGPANIIKEVKKDPDKIQLFTKDKDRKKK